MTFRDLMLSLGACAAPPRLGEELARGADPESSRLLRFRSNQLRSKAARRSLARALEARVRRAHEPARTLGTRVAIRRTEVRSCEQTLLALAERLRDDQPVDAQGVAMTHRLLTDGRSPFYYEEASHSLGFLARRALGALEPTTTQHAAPG